MAKMFKLLENELDTLNASLSHTRACIKNVESFADYILEDDDRGKYMLEMISITEKISQYMFGMDLKMKAEQEYIEQTKKKIADLFYS